MSIWELFLLGGVFMWPLLVFFIVLLYKIIERTVTFCLTDMRTDIEYIRQNVITGKIPAEHNNRFYNILADNLRMFPNDRESFDRYIGTECQQLADNLRSGLSLIAWIAAIAPVTGFLGTVTGMISVFRSINNASDVSAQLVAGGIYEALITTAAGLIISIVASAAYFILSGIVSRYCRRMEHAANSVMKSVYDNKTK
ncbi:MAG: MotA/TolQ/ExbB proton channel family protein [Spirochaetales bacterium]|nr:MotA/TolQ/ExbB proton channel family protein [Spirochaetales bacterium]